MDGVPIQIEFQFKDLNLELENPNKENLEDWQLLLRVIADFSIMINDQLFYEEFDFTVVEFAASAMRWLRKGGDFEFVSMESDLNPMLAFYRRSDGNFQPYAPDALFASEGFIKSSALIASLSHFINLLKESSQKELGIRIDRVVK